MNIVWLTLCMVVCLGGATASMAVNQVLLRRAGQLGLIDEPGGRKAHGRPTPLTGGLGMIGTFLLLATAGLAVLVVVWLVAAHNAGRLATVPNGEVQDLLDYAVNARKRVAGLSTILGASLALLLLGLADDRRPLGPWIKLCVQIAIVVSAVLLGQIRLLSLLPAYMSVPLTVVWILALINAQNFLDNMDGLSGGIAAIALAALCFVSLLQGQLFVPLLGSLLLGCVLGFLHFNVWPARVFMGDSGSLPLGFLLATMTVLTTYYSPLASATANPSAVLTPVMILAVPLYDMGTTLYTRWRQGRPLMVGDRSHISHRLQGMGMSVRQAVRTVWLLTAVTGSGAVVLHVLPGHWAWLPFAQVAAVLAIVRLLETARGGSHDSH